MKKLFCILIICLLCLCACSKEKYEASSIIVKNENIDKEISLGKEETEKVLNILNNIKWEKALYKTDTYVVFEMDDGTLLDYFPETALIMDKKRGVSFHFADEDKEYINSIIPSP